MKKNEYNKYISEKQNKIEDDPTEFLGSYLPFLLARAHHFMTDQLNQSLRQLGYSTAEWRILSVLSEPMMLDGIIVNQLTDLSLLPQPTVSRWTSTLIEKGLIERRENLEDRRRSTLVITKQGLEIFETLKNTALECQYDAIEPFSKSDVSKLIRMLRKLISGIEEENARRKTHGRRRLT